eukprot:scaffold26047_cov75-Skeletonema_dohrnii-CCMP3373.AAC.1
MASSSPATALYASNLALHVLHSIRTLSNYNIYRNPQVHHQKCTTTTQPHNKRRLCDRMKQKRSSRCNLMTIQSKRLWCSVACLPRNPPVTSDKTSVSTEGSNTRL